MQERGVVYQIQCESCNMVHIGKTLQYRVNEHKRALKLMDTNLSAVAL